MITGRKLHARRATKRMHTSRHVVSSRPTIFFVVGVYHTRLFTGAGQRSRLFFEACKEIAPVHLIVINSQDSIQRIESDFPGATETHFVYTIPWVRRGVIAKLYQSRFHRQVHGLIAVCTPWILLRQDESLRNEILKTASRTPQPVFVFRYLESLSWSGLTTQGQRPSNCKIFVDIDDRSDQKLSKSLSGHWLGKLFLPFTFLSTLAVRKLIKNINGAWLAAEEDRFEAANVPIWVVPNVPFEDKGVEECCGESDGSTILFVGGYNHQPNLNGVRWFLKYCWENIRRELPQCRFRIVGSGNWHLLEAEFPDFKGVDYIGQVDSVAFQYNEASIVVSPIEQGGGSKIKVLEAAYYERPAVVSPHSSRGYHPDFVAGLSIANNPQEFINLCIELLKDPELAVSKAKQLKQAQTKHHSFSKVKRQISKQIVSELSTSRLDIG